jgi:hypothetical protein
MDVRGGVVYSGQETTQTVNVSTLANGVYFAKITLSDNTVIFKRFIKQ